MRRCLYLAFTFMLLSICNLGWAARLRPEQVPEPLQPWIGWSLYGQEQAICPPLDRQPDGHRCLWPSRLALYVGEKGGSFELRGQRDLPGWTALPGDARYWPRQIRTEDGSALLVEQGGRPSLWLPAGPFRIRGDFGWERLPEALAAPPDAGLLLLTVNGQMVPQPETEKDGRIWLRRGLQEDGDRAAEDSVEIRLYRKLSDDNPVQLTTLLQLDVSGRSRLLRLPPLLPAGFTALDLHSVLPARLESDGALVLQVRPGRWEIRIAARHNRQLERVRSPALPQPLPAQEVWVFESRPALRLVEVEGPAPIDPEQTLLPPEWKLLPAYLMEAGTEMGLRQIRRGPADVESERLSLARELWLDFDGEGYTVRDRLGGQLPRALRIETQPGLMLGRATVDGQPQLITRLPGRNTVGVELREREVRLEAESRQDGDIRRLPAVGWQRGVNELRIDLNLGPGWTLLGATGVDHLSDSWLARWTLLDLFLVLIVAATAARLWAWPWGLLLLLTLGLSWHEPHAPRQIWLHVLAALALLRVLPAGRMATVVRVYRSIALVLLVGMALVYAGVLLRDGLYPQLGGPPLQPLRAAAPEARAMASGARADRAVDSLEEALPSAPPAAEPPKLPRFDPEAHIQTGPGLPDWRWRQVQLRWNGPVSAEQRMHLWLLPPWAGLLLAVLKVLLIAAAVLRLIGRRFPGPGANLRPLAPVALFLLAGCGGLGWAPSARAEFPPPPLLEQLRERLLQAPECAPHCSDVPWMGLRAGPDTLELRLEVVATETVAAPLPVSLEEWRPQQITLDDGEAPALFRSGDQRLWVRVEPGRHRLVLSGPLAAVERVRLPLAQAPRRVELLEVQGWNVSGIDPEGRPDAVIQLSREMPQPVGDEVLGPSALPLFVTVERTLLLGLDWRVETRVLRRSAAAVPGQVAIPLLPGEAVLTEGLQVTDGKVQISLPPGTSERRWASSLEQRSGLTLSAAAGDAWHEVWRVTTSPIWHVQSEGPPAQWVYDEAGRWGPEWHPWPGESVQLQIQRPAGAEGRTLTLERSRLSLSPGLRATDATLDFTLRASLGGQHPIRLPPGARVRSVAVDGALLPLRPEGNQLILPVRPGEQTVSVAWQEDVGIQTRYRTPAVDLGLPGVNHRIELNLGRDRWLLWTWGPRLGPAVLIWPVALLVLLVAAVLGRARLAPVRGWQWGLLLLGLTQTHVLLGALVVAWFWAMHRRAVTTATLSDDTWNLRQLGLILLTLVMLAVLGDGVRQCLLGLPEMQVAGNGSSAHRLLWYQDRSTGALPSAWAWSAPLWAYRVTALLWALWLAFSLVDWLRWSWRSYAAGGVWRSRSRSLLGDAPARGGDHGTPGAS